LEDDLVLACPFRKLHALAARLASALPFDWDAIRFDCRPTSSKDLIAVWEGLPIYHHRGLRGKGSYWGTHCTLLRSDRLGRLIAHVEANPMHDADVNLMRGSECAGRVVILVINPGFCRQNRKLRSDNLGS
jgi:hypothetical protein